MKNVFQFAMSKLKFHITLLIILFCTTAFSQNDRYIYIDDLNSEAIEYSNDGDYKLTTFYIYNKGYETKKKRDSIKQAQIREIKENPYRSPKAPTYSGINFITTSPPEKLSSLEGIITMSPKEYREGKYRGMKFKYTYIITPCEEGGYLKWKVTMLGNK